MRRDRTPYNDVTPPTNETMLFPLTKQRVSNLSKQRQRNENLPNADEKKNQKTSEIDSILNRNNRNDSLAGGVNSVPGKSENDKIEKKTNENSRPRERE